MRRVLPWLITVAGCFLVTGALATVKYQQITAAIAFGASFPEPYEVVSAQKVSTVSHTPVRRLGGTVRRPEYVCLLYTSPSPRDRQKSRMPSSA